MKKVICMLIVATLMMSCMAVAFAGSIVTPNGGRALLWRTSTSTGTDYVAYVSSGNPATLISSTPSNGRYHVNAYGYNSSWTYGYYKGWVNTAYYQD